jgi:hypothetical protein
MSSTNVDEWLEKFALASTEDRAALLDRLPANAYYYKLLHEQLSSVEEITDKEVALMIAMEENSPR